MARRKQLDGIDGLVEKGRAQGFVTYDELNSVLPPDILTGDQIDDVMEIFGENAIEVVDAFQKVPVAGRNLLIGEEEAAEEEAAEEEEAAAEEEEEIDYAGGIKGNDPVRLYLKEMGSIPLLNREGEVSLAKRIEDGERDIVSAVKNCRIALDELSDMGAKLKQGELQTQDVIKDLDEDSTEEDEQQAKEKVLNIIARIRKTRQAVKVVEDRLKKRVPEKERKTLKKKEAELGMRVADLIQEIHLKERQIESISGKIRAFADSIEVAEGRIRACCDRTKMAEKELLKLIRSIRGKKVRLAKAAMRLHVGKDRLLEMEGII
ncbi:MAG TPA: RNA polymerase sigma factor region1.1 domain-containing protein, partial [Candidatus Deferrimicrobiaceae bacterium]